MRKLRLKLRHTSYQIVIGWGLLRTLASLLNEANLRYDPVMITNPTVENLYGNALKDNLTREGFHLSTLLVPDGEEYKTLESACRLYDELAIMHAERTTPILALGGGVIGDLAGFVAATYMRGLPLIQIPTTLLAQVDSSIGGKVAVDYGQIKNKIGVFYQPALVVVDTATLQTLPAKEHGNGMAEIIKYAMIADKKLFTYLEKNISSIRSGDRDVLEEIIYRSDKIKASVVEKDERDLGLRHILNFGHTAGHAIESASDFKINHGQAVALGMLVACRVALRLGYFSYEELLRLHNIIREAGLPVEMPDLPRDKIMQAMAHDKKNVDGKLRFVLPKSIGSVFISHEVSPSLVEEVFLNWNEKA